MISRTFMRGSVIDSPALQGVFLWSQERTIAHARNQPVAVWSDRLHPASCRFALLGQLADFYVIGATPVELAKILARPPAPRERAPASGTISFTMWRACRAHAPRNARPRRRRSHLGTAVAARSTPAVFRARQHLAPLHRSKLFSRQFGTTDAVRARESMS